MTRQFEILNISQRQVATSKLDEKQLLESLYIKLYERGNNNTLRMINS